MACRTFSTNSATRREAPPNAPCTAGGTASVTSCCRLASPWTATEVGRGAGRGRGQRRPVLLDLVPKAMRCGNRVSRKSRSRLCVGMRLTWSGPGPAPALWCREESAVRVDRRSKPAVRANATSVTMCQRAPRAHDSNVRPGCASLADTPRGARWPCVCGRNRQGRGGPRGFRDQTGCVLRTALSSDAVPASRPLVLSTLAARTFGECPRLRGPEQRGGSGRGGRA